MARLGSRQRKALAKGIRAKHRVLSLDKRDRQSLFQGQSFQTVRDTPPPTFLFLLNLQLSKNRRNKVVSTKALKRKSPAEPVGVTCLHLQEELQSEFVGRQQRRRPRW